MTAPIRLQHALPAIMPMDSAALQFESFFQSKASLHYSKMNIVTAFKLTVCEWTIKFYVAAVKLAVLAERKR